MMSSFRKRNVQKTIIPGTRASAQTGQMITSSGNLSLDGILGGGLQIGSICLIEEDRYVTHSKVLAKYFLAEGVVWHQSVFLGSLDDDPNELLHKLPKPHDSVMFDVFENSQTAQEENQTLDGGGDDATKNGLRIAWRYNNMPLISAEHVNARIGHDFDLTEHIDTRTMQYAELTMWNDTVNTKIAYENEYEDEEETDQFETQDAPVPSSTGVGGEATYTIEKDVEMENSKNSDNTADATAETVGDAATTAAENTPEAMDLDELQRAVTPSPPPLSTTGAATPPPPPPYEASIAAAAAAAALQLPKIFKNEKYARCLHTIQQLLRKSHCIQASLGQNHQLYRICLTSLGSPLWYDEHFAKDILKFLTVLRAVVRNASAVCFITLPMHLVAKLDVTLVSKIRNLVDYAVELESFIGSAYETNLAYKEYHGLLHLHKITALNTLNSYLPETSDWAFKLHRKKFVIEKLHLPPESEDSSESATAAPTLSCTSSSAASDKATLDF